MNLGPVKINTLMVVANSIQLYRFINTALWLLIMIMINYCAKPHREYKCTDIVIIIVIINQCK